MNKIISIWVSKIKPFVILSALSFSLLFGCAPAYSNEIKELVTGKIIESECAVVAKENSIVGSAVGGTAGAVGGALVGEALFGKSGGWVGGIVGGMAGGAAGNAMASTTTYSCNIILDAVDKKYIFTTLTNSPPSVGKVVKMVELMDGTKKLL